MISKTLALILLTTLSQCISVRRDDSLIKTDVIDKSLIELNPVEPQPDILVVGPIETSPIEAQPDILVEGPIKRPPIVIDPIKPIKENPCIVDNCRCFDKNGMRSMIYLYCPNNTQQCLQNYGECKLNSENTCEFSQTFSPKLQTCLNKAGYCQKFGCGLEKCQRDLGYKVKLQCLVYPTNTHCYADANCGVNRKGECEYESSIKFEKCLLTDRLLNTKVSKVTPISKTEQKQ